MRVAILTTSYPSHDGDPAGHFVRAEAVDLARDGHEVHVIAPANAGGAVLQDPSIKVWPVAHGELFGWPGAVARLRQAPWRAPGAAAFAWNATDCLAGLRPDRIQAHWLVPSAWPIALNARSDAALECVAHGGDVRLLCGLPARVRERILGHLVDRAAALRFVAQALLDRLCSCSSRELRARIGRIAVVRPCSLYVPDVSRRAGEVRSTCQGKHLLTAVGRLVPSKRVDLAVQAANLLGADARLHVIGDGPELARLQRLDRAGNVTFEGAVDRNEALAWISASSTVIHASESEAAPTVVREARLLRIPVVACDAGDIAAWARTDQGIRLAEPSPRAIAAAVGATWTVSSANGLAG